MSKTVTLQNIGNEPLAFAGIPLIQPKATFEVSEEQAVILLRNENVQQVQKTSKTSKATEKTDSE